MPCEVTLECSLEHVDEDITRQYHLTIAGDRVQFEIRHFFSRTPDRGRTRHVWEGTLQEWRDIMSHAREGRVEGSPFPAHIPLPLCVITAPGREDEIKPYTCSMSEADFAILARCTARE